MNARCWSKSGRPRALVPRVLILVAFGLVGCALRADVQGPGLAAKSGEVWTHPKTGKRMILVPAGFYEGSPFGKSGGGFVMPLVDRQMKTKVVAALAGLGECAIYSPGFFMDETEVSNREYLRYISASGCKKPAAWGNLEPSEAHMDLPVRVSIAEAKEYANWAVLDIPAFNDFVVATADEQGSYPWTSELPGTESMVTDGEGSRVGSRAADVSPLGIKDLIGNAPEWGNSVVEKRGQKCVLTFLLVSFGATTRSSPTSPDKREEKWAMTLFRPVGGTNLCGFRCVDRGIAVRALTSSKFVGARATLGKSPGQLSMRKVYIRNETGRNLTIRLSSLVEFDLKEGEAVTKELPLGDYLVYFFEKADKPQLVRFWRASVSGDVTDGNTWTISSKVGEPLGRGGQN